MMLYSQDASYLIDTKSFVLKVRKSFESQKCEIVATSVSCPSLEITMGKYDTQKECIDTFKSLVYTDPFGLAKEDF